MLQLVKNVMEFVKKDFVFANDEYLCPICSFGFKNELILVIKDDIKKMMINEINRGNKIICFPLFVLNWNSSAMNV